MTRSTPPAQILPHWLFGLHIAEIAKFFRDRFREMKVNYTQNNTTSLQVAYGTPRAAFRWNIQRFNGKVILPMLSFFIFDYNRNGALNRPVNLYTYDSIDEVNGTILGMRAPMHFTLNINFNLFTNNNRERDLIMHNLFQSMPLGDMWLHHFPDPINHPDIVLAIPLQMDDSVADETEIEGLDVGETKDVVRTVFNMQAKCIIPMKTFEVPIVRKIKGQITQILESSQSAEDIQIELTKTLLYSQIVEK